MCQQNNPKIQRQPPPTSLANSAGPGQFWQIDFTELPKAGGFKYLLVMTDHFSKWPEAWPCQTNKAREVTKKLLKEVIPRFPLPLYIGSDNIRHFTDTVVQEVSRALGINWKLHCSWNPKSSSQVEHFNQSLKRHLSKLCQETRQKWTEVLPITLARIRAAPNSHLGLSPFEIL